MLIRMIFYQQSILIPEVFKLYSYFVLERKSSIIFMQPVNDYPFRNKTWHKIVD